MGKRTSLTMEELKELIHAETQVKMIKDSIKEMKENFSAEDILEDIELTLKV